MKKILSIIVLSFGILILTACAARRDQAPILLGVVENQTIEIKQPFNPLEGVTATDREDGDLTSSITYTGWESGDENFSGTYEIVLSVTDSAGQTATATIYLTVTGGASAAPVISGYESIKTYYLNTPLYDPLEGVTAIDPVHGDLTDQIIILGSYDLTAPGTYSIRLRVENEDEQRATVTITLIVVDPQIPTTLPTTPTTITFWHANGADITALYNKYARGFEAMMLADHGVNVIVNIADSSGTYTTLRSNMIQAITAGVYPNLVQGYPDHVAEYLNGKVVVNLDPYIQNNQWGMIGEEDFEDILLPYRQENSQYDSLGTFYSLPLNKSTEVMLYNKTVFDELNLPIPTTWQEINEISDALKAHAASKGTQNFMPAAYDSDGNAFITFTRQFGGEYTAINFETGRGQFLFHTNSNTFAAMSFLRNNRNTLVLPKQWDADYATNAFLNQQVYLTIGSTAGVWRNVPGGYKPDSLGTTFEVGVAPIPYNRDLPQHRSVIQQGTNVSILNASPEEQLLSFLFLKYLTNTENTVDLAINIGYLPVRYSGQTHPRYVEFLSREKDAIALASKAAFDQSAYFFYDPAFVGSSRSRVQVGLALERIIHGDGNIQSALDEAFANANIGG